MRHLFFILLLTLSTSNIAGTVHLIDYNLEDSTSGFDSLLIYNAPKKYQPKPRIKKIDPLEKINRKIYKFNDALDRAILKPVAKGYRKITPKPVRTGIKNVFSNIDDVFVVSNDILQFKPKQTLQDTTRFLVNSTVGLAGIFDVASKIGLPKHDEDFGQTLHKWGFPQGPYIMLPFLGPSSGRHATGTLVRWYAGEHTSYNHNGKDIYIYAPAKNLNPKSHRPATRAAEIIILRESLLDSEETLDSIAIDKYATLRDAFLQSRNFRGSDGDTGKPMSAIPGEDEDLTSDDTSESEFDEDDALLDTPTVASNQADTATKGTPQPRAPSKKESVEAMLEDDDDLVE